MTTNPVWQMAVDAARASDAKGQLVNEEARSKAMETVVAVLTKMFGVAPDDVWTDTVASGTAVIEGYTLNWVAWGSYVSFSIELPCVECGATISGPYDFSTKEGLGRIFMYWQAAKDLRCPECGATDEDE